MNIRSIFATAVFAFCFFVIAQNGLAQAASPEEAVKTALNVGATIPSFELKDATGKLVSSRDLMKDGNLVIVFYRGSWCPFCNTYLHTLQTRLTDITGAGGKLVAISIENPDASMAVAKKNEVQFTVLSDPDLYTAKKFGIVYVLPAATDQAYKSHGLDVAKHNAMAKPELPLAVTYVVDKHGKIVYAYLDADFRKRAEPDVIVANLQKIK